jgi:carbonic anhydrase/acetyltransferase-like protein (isoleucine patch superfamily)
VTIRSTPSHTPRIHPGAWVDPAALVIGDVEIAEGASIWPFTVVRGDEGQSIRIGRNTNVQDHCVVHVHPDFPCVIGEGVTIGHRSVVHGCTVGNNVRIGIGAIVLNGAVIEDDAQVAAGSLVPQGKVVPAGTLVMGVPAKPLRKMNQAELDDIRWNAREYLELWQREHRAGAAAEPGRSVQPQDLQAP